MAVSAILFHVQTTDKPHIHDHELIRLVGRGAYGEVWYARNALGTPRAVKIVRRDRFDSDRPYLREFSGIQKFEPISRSHDGLVDILQVGRNDEASFFYYVMELADDATVSTEIPASSAESPEPSVAAYTDTTRERSAQTYQARTLASEIKKRGCIPPKDALPLFNDLAVAVGHIHSHGLLHRDIKPSNVIFVAGVPKLADIGLVAPPGESETFVGTLGFIPPEGPGTVSADLYALGKLMYEAVTGRDRQDFPVLPLDPATPTRNAELLELNEILLRCCDPSPTKRYQNAAELQTDLAVLRSGHSVQRLRAFERNFRVARKFGVLASLAATVAIGASLIIKRQEQTASRHFQVSEKFRLRAEAAERASGERLYSSLIARARAERRSGVLGSRESALSAVREAAQIHADSGELRTEAIAALAMIDLRETKRWKTTSTASLPFCFSPDAQFLAESLTNGTIRVRRVSDDGAVATIIGDGHPIEWLGPFSSDHRWLGSWGDSGLFIWDTLLQERHLRLDPVIPWNFIHFIPGTPVLIYAVNSKIVKIDMESGTQVERTISKIFDHFAANASGTRFAISRNAEGSIGIYDFPSLRPTQVLRLPTNVRLQSMDWNAEGTMLATGSTDHRASLWEILPPGDSIVTNDRANVEFTGHGAEVTAASFNRAGNLLYTSSWDETTRIWGVNERRQLAQIPSSSSAGMFSDDGRNFTKYESLSHEAVLSAVNSYDYCRLVTELGTPAVKSPNHAIFTPDSQWLITAGEDGIRSYRVSDGHPEAFLPCAAVLDVQMFPEPAKQFASLTDDGRFLFEWKTTSSGAFEFGSKTRIQSRDMPKLHPKGLPWFGRNGNLTRIWKADGSSIDLPESENPTEAETSNDGHFAAIVSEYSQAAYWRIEAGAPKCSLGPVRSSGIAFSPDSRAIFHVTAREVFRTATATGQTEWHTAITDNDHSDGDLAVSEDGRMVAALANRYQIALLDADSGRLLAMIEHPYPQMITAIAFSPNASYLAAACTSHITQLWNLKAVRGELAKINLDW